MTKYRKHIAAYIVVKITRFFTHALTSNSWNWTSPKYHTDHFNSGGPPTERTHKISTNSGRFPCSSTKFPFKHAHIHLVKSGGGQVRTHERSIKL